MVNAKDLHVATAAVFGHADAVLTEDRRLRVEVAGLWDVMAISEFLT